MYLFSGGTFNPLIGAAGISAFPMSARVVQRVGQEYDFDNFLLMHAMGANTAGQLGSVVAGGVVLAMLTGLF
jgi:oxaloacetate decarboxylase beta subunit